MRPGLDATCYLIPYPAPGQKVLGDGALLGGCGGAVVRDRPPRPATAPGRCSARRAAAATAAPRRSEPAASGRSSAPVPPRSTATPGARVGSARDLAAAGASVAELRVTGHFYLWRHGQAFIRFGGELQVTTLT